MNSKIRNIGIVLICLSSLFTLAAEQSEKIKSSQIKPGSYRIGANGEYYPETNSDEFWSSGVWSESTNGLRVVLYCWDTNTSNPHISVAVGSRVINSEWLVGTPNGKFSKFELLDTNGIAVQPDKGQSMEYQFPAKMPINKFPKWPDGGIKNVMGFLSNSPPASLNDVQIRNVFKIKKEGDYTLTVCAVIYKYDSNPDYLDRIDLPCVTTKIHLMPSQ